MLPLAAEFDPLEDGGLASELSTHQDCAGSATRNLSSGEGETLQSFQTGKCFWCKAVVWSSGMAKIFCFLEPY